MSDNSYFNIFQELIKWSKELENWQRFALLQFLRNGGLDEHKIKTIYEEFKIDKDLSQVPDDRKTCELKSSFIPQVGKQLKPVILREICNAKGVNALVEGQVLRFGPKLTVVYGPNGSGKSGYARIFKAACFTRSQDTEILGNVNLASDVQEQTSAMCIFADTSTIELSEGETCPQLRDNFAIFDSSCVRVYTDERKEFNVRPYGFDVFPYLVNVMTSIRDLLREEVKHRTPDIDNFKIDDSSSRIAQILNNLNVDTNIDELDKLKAFDDAEEKMVQKISHQIKELEKKDPTEVIKQKERYVGDIEKLVSNISDTDGDLGIETAKQVESSIAEIGKLREIAAAASAAQFGKEPVQPIGTKAWRLMIEAAINYNEEAYPALGFPPDLRDARCVLCQQPLKKEARDRLSRFFSFVRSDAEKKLSKAVKELSSLRKKLETVDILFFSKETALRRTVEDCDPDLANDVNTYIGKSSKQREKLFERIDQEKWGEIPAIGKSPLSRCKELKKNLEKEIAGLKIFPNGKRSFRMSYCF